ncbi:MAG: Tfx family DNA-binding protein [Methanomicrobiales archaeon]|jgi:Tfx family DNA-binding protein|nr:Tfx family DNA-binding protein [Methanomicrobiales archaeon]
MKYGLLTDRQKEVLRYRKAGYTQQQIAELIQTSKANVCTIEKSAYENVKRARETIEFIHTLDARHLCSIERGTDLIAAAENIFDEAGKMNIKVIYNTLEVCDRIKEQVPDSFRGRKLRADIEVYIKDNGDLYFE